MIAGDYRHAVLIYKASACRERVDGILQIQRRRIPLSVKLDGLLLADIRQFFRDDYIPDKQDIAPFHLHGPENSGCVVGAVNNRFNGGAGKFRSRAQTAMGQESDPRIRRRARRGAGDQPVVRLLGRFEYGPEVIQGVANNDRPRPMVGRCPLDGLIWLYHLEGFKE